MEIERGNISDISFLIKQRRNFWDYAGTKSDLLKLSKHEREAIYLTWRYGSSNFDGNKESEFTDMALLETVKRIGVSSFNGSRLKFWEAEIRNYETSMEIKYELRLIEQNPNNKKAEYKNIVKELNCKI